jgi:hypothetical protein
MQLKAVLACLAIWLIAPAAWADGEIELRGKYYKERATRVIQPMLDMRVEPIPELEIKGHLVVDSITSASVAAGAAGQAFVENRSEGGGGVAYRAREYQLGIFARYSYEPDYKSLFGGARVAAELADKNTTVALMAARGLDDISNAGAQNGGLGQLVEISGQLTSTVASFSLSQVLSPLLVAGVSYDVIYLNGFQENAYREVIAQGMLHRERVPDTRLRQAIFASIRGFWPTTRSTLVAGYRFYFDDWGLMAHTPEIRLIQDIRSGLDIHIRYRYHRQTGADFYQPVYDSSDPSIEPFLTDDIKLSSFDGHTYGLAVESTLAHLGASGALALIRAKLSLDYAVQNNRFGNAVIGQFGIAMPF